MSESPEVLIVTHDPETEQLAAALTQDAVNAMTARSFDSAVHLLQGNSRCICVIDADVPGKLLVQLCEFASKNHGRRVVVLYGPNQAASSFPPGVALCPKGRTLLESMLRLKAALVMAGHDVRIISTDRNDLAPAQELPPEQGEVIAVFSVKGGVGKTTIAVNLAVGLAQLYGHAPLLVDGNLYFGDVPILMNLTPKNSIADLCAQPHFDALTLKALVSEEQFGVSILGSPPDMTAVDRLDTQVLTQAITAYRGLFDYIIVDTRSSLDEATLQLLDAADRILLVITPELSSLYQTSRFLAVAEALEYQHKLKLVLNRAGSGLDVRSVEEHLGQTIFAHIVSSGPQVLGAANRGVPLLVDDPDRKKKTTRDLVALAEQVGMQCAAPATAEHAVQEPAAARARGLLGLPGKLLLGGAS